MSKCQLDILAAQPALIEVDMKAVCELHRQREVCVLGLPNYGTQNHKEFCVSGMVQPAIFSDCLDDLRSRAPALFRGLVEVSLLQLLVGLTEEDSALRRVSICYNHGDILHGHSLPRRSYTAVGLSEWATDERRFMRISKSGQVTIPKELRERFGLHRDVEVEITAIEGGLLISKHSAVEHPVDRVAGILDGRDFDVDEYIQEIRGR